MKRWFAHTVLFVFLGCPLSGHCQKKKPIFLGEPSAIVLGLELVTEKGLVVANLTDKIQLWDYQRKALVQSWNADGIIAIDYFKEKIAGVSKNGEIVIWHIDGDQRSLQKKISESSLISVAWVDSIIVAIGSDNGELITFNSLSGEVVSRIKTTAAITALASVGTKIFAGDSKGVLTCYRIPDLRMENSLNAHNSWIREIHIADDMESFVTVSDDGSYKKWNSSQPSDPMQREFLGNWILCVDYYSSTNKGLQPIMAFGKRNGDIQITSRFGNYSTNLNSLVNGIAIVKSELPTLVVVVATYGNGLQIIHANSMKMSPK